MNDQAIDLAVDLYFRAKPLKGARYAVEDARIAEMEKEVAFRAVMAQTRKVRIP